MGTLRVISGFARGRRLKTVPGDVTRPITDRVKESLFNIIGGDILGASFFDLFAGTGSVGIEALSRGADYIRFCDVNPKAIKTIGENLKIVGSQDNCDVIKSDAFNLLRGEPDCKFDYIYVAPPQYHQMWIAALLNLDLNINWLNDDGWVIVQIHPVEYKSIDDVKNIKHLEEFDQRRYGSTKLVFYQKKSSD
jgi:16S rRNA (guanine966-N2)-methyltransferase